MISRVSGFCLFSACAGLLVGLSTTPADAAYLVSNDQSFSYTGTVTPPAGSPTIIPSYTSTPGSTIYDGRDVAIYATSNAPTALAGAGNENYTSVGTNYYASTLHNDSGTGNPNNTDTGFFQLYNTTNHNVTSATGGWTDTSYTTFTMSIVGTTTDPTSIYNRLWAAPKIGGPGSDTRGIFQTYTVSLTATFAPGDVTETTPGWYATEAEPISVTGSIVGTFQNTSPTVAYNGLYAFDLSFENTNWAGSNDIPDNYGSYFGASQVVPEPATMALLGVGLFSLAMIRRRRNEA